MAPARPDPRTASTLQRMRMLIADTAVYGLASAVSKSFALILFPILTRSLSVADYGRLDLALYAAMLIGLVIIWGQDSAMARLFFEKDDVEDRRQTISQALLLVASNCMLVILAAALVAQPVIAADFFGPRSWLIVALLLVYASVSALLSFCQGLLKWTFQRNRYIALALGVPATNLIVLTVLARTEGFGPVTALLAMTVVGATFAAVALTMIRTWLVIPRDAGKSKALLPLALPYGLIAVIAALAPLVERSVVAGRFGASELGLYAAAAKIASIATMLAMAFQMSWGPFAYALYKEASAARTYNLVLRAFSAFMCLAVLTLSLAATPIAALLAGDRFLGAAHYVFPLAMAFGLQAIGWVTEIGIHLSKRPHLNLLGFGALLGTSLLGILVLSRMLGIIGVPLGAMAGQLAMLVISAFVAQRAYPIEWAFAVPAATIAATLGSGLLALFAPVTHPGWFYAAGIVLVLAINLAFGMRKGDWRRMRELGGAMTARLRQQRD